MAGSTDFHRVSNDRLINSNNGLAYSNVYSTSGCKAFEKKDKSFD
jgi:hypothetical protein